MSVNKNFFLSIKAAFFILIYFSNVLIASANQTITGSISGLISLVELLDLNKDQNKLHEAIPQGVPRGYDWALSPRIGAGNNPEKFSAVTGWGQVFWEDSVKNSKDRIQIQNFKFFICYGIDHRWMLLQNDNIVGAQFRADYKNNINNAPSLFYERNNLSTVAFDKGTVFHFWPKSGRVVLPSKDICGVLALLQARVVPGSRQKEIIPNSFLIGLGADYWITQNSKWENYTSNKDIAIGRLKLIQSDWAWYGLSTAKDNDLKLLYENGYEIPPKP